MRSITFNDFLKQRPDKWDNSFENMIVKTKNNDVVIVSIEIVTDPTQRSSVSRYSYRIFVENKNVNKTQLVVGVQSRIFNANFIEGLYKYYEKVIDLIIEDDKSYYMYNYTVSRAARNLVLTKNYRTYFTNANKLSKADKFIRKHSIRNEIFTEEMIVEYLIILSDLTANNDEVKKVMKEYFAIVKDTSIDLQNKFELSRYVSPVLAVFSERESEFLSLVSFQYPQYKTIESTKLFYKLLALLKYERFNKRKDFTLVDNKEKIKDIDMSAVFDQITDSDVNTTVEPRYSQKFNVQINKIADYINDLTVKEFFKLSKNKEAVTFEKGPEFVHYADMVLSNKTRILTDDELHEAKRKLEKHAENSLDLAVLNFYRSSDAKDYYIIQVINDYVDSLENTKLSNRELESLLKLLRSKSSYIPDGRLANWLFYELSNRMSGAEIIMVIQDVISHHKNLTVTEWEKYLDNYKEYKELPVSWWTELLK